jgi:hypothetical protein
MQAGPTFLISGGRIFQGGATPTVAEAARVDAALDVAEVDLREAVCALAVLRGSFAADSAEVE